MLQQNQNVEANEKDEVEAEGKKSKSTSGKTICYLDGKQLNRNAEHSDLCLFCCVYKCCYNLTLITVLICLVAAAATTSFRSVASSYIRQILFAETNEQNAFFALSCRVAPFRFICV